MTTDQTWRPERGDTPSIVVEWFTDLVTVSDVWSLQIRSTPEWIVDLDNDYLILSKTPTITNDGSDPVTVDSITYVTTTLTPAEVNALPTEAYYGVRLSNDNGSDTIISGKVLPFGTPVEPVTP